MLTADGIGAPEEVSTGHGVSLGSLNNQSDCGVTDRKSPHGQTNDHGHELHCAGEIYAIICPVAQLFPNQPAARMGKNAL